MANFKVWLENVGILAGFGIAVLALGGLVGCALGWVSAYSIIGAIVLAIPALLALLAMGAAVYVLLEVFGFLAGMVLSFFGGNRVRVGDVIRMSNATRRLVMPALVALVTAGMACGVCLARHLAG